ncbi:MAG: c-type cytochrome [Pseudomonadota bacterium]
MTPSRRRVVVAALLAPLWALVAGCEGVGEAHDGPGGQTYLRYCYSCHAGGIAGAPRVGDVDAWSERASAGLDHLLARTIAGIEPGMPPRGACRECSDDQLAAAIEHMLALSGLSYSSDGTLQENEP